MTPEETAEKLLSKMEKTTRKAAEFTVDSTIGEMVLKLFSASSTITLEGVISAFEEVVSGRNPDKRLDGVRMQAEAAITALQALAQKKGP